MIDYRETARIAMEELDGGWLTVVKIRTEHGWVRVAVERNTEWYSAFCRKHVRQRRGRFRRPRTIIKRDLTRRALGRIADGRRDGVYVGRLLEFFSSWDFRVQPREAHIACDEPW